MDPSPTCPTRAAWALRSATSRLRCARSRAFAKAPRWFAGPIGSVISTPRVRPRANCIRQQLATHLEQEKTRLVEEAAHLSSRIDHVKEIVDRQLKILYAGAAKPGKLGDTVMPAKR